MGGAVSIASFVRGGAALGGRRLLGARVARPGAGWLAASPCCSCCRRCCPLSTSCGSHRRRPLAWTEGDRVSTWLTALAIFLTGVLWEAFPAVIGGNMAAMALVVGRNAVLLSIAVRSERVSWRRDTPARRARRDLRGAARARLVSRTRLARDGVGLGGAGPRARRRRGRARAGRHFARDYVTAHARVHLGRGGPPVGESGNDYGRAVGAPRSRLLDGPYFIHPPPALLAILPLVPLGFHGAALAWLALSLLALGVLAFFPRGSGRARRRARHRAGALLALVLLVWPPVLHNLSKGQWSILLAALIAAGGSALARGRPRAAASASASQRASKQRRSSCSLTSRSATGAPALAMTGTLATAAALSVAANGSASGATGSPTRPATSPLGKVTANTVSLGGALGRLFAGAPTRTPLVAAPRLRARAHGRRVARARRGRGALRSRARAPATPHAERRPLRGLDVARRRPQPAGLDAHGRARPVPARARGHGPSASVIPPPCSSR